MQLKKGTLLDRGKYRVESILGQGGFGITYLAIHLNLNRKVAVKEFFMREHCNRDGNTSFVSVPSEGSKALVERFKAKFIKEAHVLSEMNCHGVITIYDAFEENGTAYYVMEYIEGGALGEIIPTDGLPETLALEYIRKIGHALHYLHTGKHMLHLDVKPSNVLFRTQDELVLIDFGVSKHYDVSDGSQTSSTPLALSNGYAPMEQYKNDGVEKFTPETDIYALGATLYKLLTGVNPPHANDVFNYGLNEFPAKVSERVRHAVQSAMQPRPSERPGSVSEFLQLLDGEQAGSDDATVLVGPTSPPSPPTPPVPPPVLPTPPVPPVPSASSDAADPEKNGIVISEEELEMEYQRLVATQKYSEAFRLCLYNLKTSSKARLLMSEAKDNYLKKSGRKVYLPTRYGMTYSRLTDLLLSKGYKKMSLKENLKLSYVTIQLKKQRGEEAVTGVEVKRGAVLIRTLCNIVAVLVAAWLALGAVAAQIPYWKSNLWDEYVQVMGGNAITPDPWWIVISLAALCAAIGIVWTTVRLNTRKFKAIRTIVADEVIEDWKK